MNMFTYKLGYRVSACLAARVSGAKDFALGVKNEVTDLVASTGRSVKYKVGCIGEATKSLGLGVKDGWRRGNAEAAFAQSLEDIAKKL